MEAACVPAFGSEELWKPICRHVTLLRQPHGISKPRDVAWGVCIRALVRILTSVWLFCTFSDRTISHLQPLHRIALGPVGPLSGMSGTTGHVPPEILRVFYTIASSQHNHNRPTNHPRPFSFIARWRSGKQSVAHTQRPWPWVHMPLPIGR